MHETVFKLFNFAIIYENSTNSNKHYTNNEV